MENVCCPECGKPGEFLQQDFETQDPAGIAIVNLMACRNPNCPNYLPPVFPADLQIREFPR